ncbi:MAG: DNA polymerase III subunit delta [Verrucomicrobiota bacterium]
MATKRKSPAKKKAASAAKAGNVFVFLGTDEAQVKEAALKKSQALTPADAGDFGIDVVDGVSENSDSAARIVRDAIQALQTLPFFGGDKVVWLKNANFLGDSVTGRAAATVDAVEGLKEILEAGLPDSVKFILSATEIDKRRGFYKYLQKNTSLDVFDKPDTSREGWEVTVAPMVRQRAKALGLELEGEALELFVMLAGADSRVIDGELEKLDLFLGAANRKVSVDAVRQLVSQSRAGIVFELGNAIGCRQFSQSLKLLDQLMAQGENAIGILLAAIVPKVRNLLIARDLLETHRIGGANYRSFSAALERLPSRDVAHLPRKADGGISAYPVFLALNEARQFSLEHLRQSLSACLEANKQLVTTQLEPKFVLTRLLAKILT